MQAVLPEAQAQTLSYVRDRMTPRWRLFGIETPSPGFTASRFHTWSELDTYHGEAEVALLRFPVEIPNCGIPGTNLNVSQMMLNWWPAALALAIERQGGVPMAAAIYEYRTPDAGFWGCPGADGLTYEVVFLAHGSIVMPGIAISLMAILVFIAGLVAIDRVTDGALTRMFTQFVETVGGAAEEIIQAPFSAVTVVLLGGMALLGTMAVVLSKAGVTPVGVAATQVAATPLALLGPAPVRKAAGAAARRGRR